MKVMERSRTKTRIIRVNKKFLKCRAATHSISIIMAITKRRATKKSSGTKTTAKRKKSTAKAGKKKIAGLLYDPAGCFNSKTAAAKSAETIRKSGKKARVIPNSNGKGACIYTR